MSPGKAGYVVEAVTAEPGNVRRHLHYGNAAVQRNVRGTQVKHPIRGASLSSQPGDILSNERLRLSIAAQHFDSSGEVLRPLAIGAGDADLIDKHAARLAGVHNVLIFLQAFRQVLIPERQPDIA